MGSSRRWSFLVLVLVCAFAPGAGDFAAAAAPDSTSTIAGLRRDAANVLPLMKTSLARDFLGAAVTLPAIPTRTLFQDTLRRAWYVADDLAPLPDSIRGRIVRREFDDRYYYTTRYGTPMAYARPLEILGEAGVKGVEGMRIADFGYGTIGHLKMLAGLGADVIGIEVDPLLEKLYAFPGDQGDAGDRGGSLELVSGRFPVDPVVVAAVGGGYDLFVSKNTLKHGYVHPEQEVDPRMRVNLGVDDSTFVHTLAGILQPGGHALVYNLCPAPNGPGLPYRPWADGRSPFPRALWEAAGFEVLAFDRNDDDAAREMGHALGWDRGPSPMKLDTDLFALYTLVRKRP